MNECKECRANAHPDGKKNLVMMQASKLLPAFFYLGIKIKKNLTKITLAAHKKIAETDPK